MIFVKIWTLEKLNKIAKITKITLNFLFFPQSAIYNESRIKLSSISGRIQNKTC